MDYGIDLETSPFGLGEFCIEPNRNVIEHNGATYPIEPRIMQVLCYLAAHAGDVVTRTDLINTIWNNEHGADERVTRAISILRKTFKKADEESNYIETIPKKGYRLLLPVTSITTPASKPPLASGPAIPHSQDKVAPHNNGTRFSIATISAIAALVAVIAFLIIDSSGNTGKKVPTRSVAVLPFISMSVEEEDKLFAAGLSEELLNTLASIEDLKVPSRTSSFDYQGQTGDVKKIGAALGVAHILEGSIRRSGSRIRITAQLISAHDGYHLWSDTYDREVNDIFVIQDDIARRVALALNSNLVDDNNVMLFDVGTQNAQAFEHFLKGRQYLERRGLELARAITSFETAIELDPDYANAYAQLAVANSVATTYLDVPKEIARKRARIFAEKANSLDPTLSVPFAVLGVLEINQFHWQEAIQYYRQAEKLNPDDITNLQWYAEALSYLGYSQEAMQKIERAIALEPTSPVLHLVAGNIAKSLDDLEKTENHYNRATQLERRAIILQHNLRVSGNSSILAV